MAFVFDLQYKASLQVFTWITENMGKTGLFKVIYFFGKQEAKLQFHCETSGQNTTNR